MQKNVTPDTQQLHRNISVARCLPVIKNKGQEAVPLLQSTVGFVHPGRYYLKKSEMLRILLFFAGESVLALLSSWEAFRSQRSNKRL